MAAAGSLARESRWLRSVVRAVLAFACLYAQVFFSSLERPLTMVTAAYVVYSLVALLWKKIDEIQVSLPSLFVDTAFFIAFSVYGADKSGWIGTMLFLYLMTVAVMHHDWSDVCIIVGACIGFYAFVRRPDAAALRHVVVATGLLACLAGDMKRRLQDRLLEAGRREAALRAEAEHIRDQERQRIAGDFHDGPLQSFIGLQVRLDILETLFKRDRNAALEDLRELQQIARSQVSEIRSFLRSMKPVEVDSSDLVTSVRRIVEYFQKDTAISARFISAQSEVRLPPEIGQEVLQILREALHNVQKHSKASRVVVALEHAGKNVEISVDDDGTGFAFSGTFSLDELDLLRLGPQSIKRRVRSLGGDLQIESRPGHGAGLKIRVPVTA
ncbi:MAG TPA: sensor histidine kinase [Bryobacteraceae bacterium]|nr:sensor histidine kinase [Bryobacteraceae bacterium]HOL71307.1 sensor histidine kinase [Bryobacteraceae bacterium]HOQ45380.1 sensor histidine kinase [Bryobacteraceae bacterium]HPQ14824.1 sensor histidine kinase [Bryobacteraceae bacterium]HPU71309.1 sensor histidine kinase [Bryobacteraceae bacterium]